MKHRIVEWLALASLVVAFAGCVQYNAPVMPPQGGIYTHFQAPLDVKFDGTPVCEKQGEAKSSYVGLPVYSALSVGWDDAMIAKAAENGGLKQVEYADYELMSILGVYAEFTVHAYGK